ncbi:MAG: alpha/beta fold hydrolase [Actinomycetes bacterium]
MTEPRHLTANGVDIAYLEAGPTDGPLALCLHGFPDHAPTWRHLMPLLAGAGYHVVAPWLRGYSPTGLAPDGNYQVASLALDALALTDALAGDGDAVIVGHDWGAIATHTAVAHRPDRYSRMVALAVPHAAAMGAHLFEPEQLKRMWYQFFFQLPTADIVVPMNDYAVIDTLWRDWSPGYTPDPDDLRALKATFDAPGALSAALDYYRFVHGTKPSDPALDAVQGAFLAPIPVPTLYLHGADDGCMGAGMVADDELRPWYPAGVEIVVVPDSGHFLHLEQPDAVNARIVGFLAR